MSVSRTEIESRLGTELFTKYDAFIPSTDITEQRFTELTVQILKVEAASNTATGTVTTAAPAATPVINTIKLWAVSPLNPSDASFAKALENERLFKETSEIKLFNLDRSKWITFRNHIMLKSDRCCLTKILEFPIASGGTSNLNLLKSYSQFTRSRVKEYGDSFWDSTAITAGMTNVQQNEVNDKRILSNMLGEFLLSSITLSAQNKVKIEMQDYQKSLNGANYFDGGLIYWIIANLTQPNNDRLAEGIFEELKNLNVRNYKFSVKDMLSRFKELCEELDGHGVAYDSNTKQLDFWRCAETMKETEFATFVNREREEFRKAPRATRQSIDSLIQLLIDKQTNMESDKKWNKLSMEQAQILSLIATCEGKDATDNTKKPTSSSGDGKKSGPRPWRLKGPKAGEPLERVTKGGHSFKWDPVGNNGTGIWQFVKPGKDDSSDEKRKPSTNVEPSTATEPSPKKARKTVTFDEKTKDATKIEVNKARLLANLAHLDDSQRAFITQFVPKD